jgi:hypothetical protein
LFEQKVEEKPDELFKPIEEVAPLRRLKVGVYGIYATGKTHFALTFPEPVYVIDTEFGSVPLRKKFEGKKIYVLECFVQSQEEGKADPIKSLALVEKAVKLLSTIKSGTVVLDSISDIWTWEELRMKEIVSEKGRDVYQFDWGIANRHYLDIIRALLSYPLNLVITAKTREVYDTEGKPTGMIEARWQKDTPYFVDVVVRMTKRFYPIGEGKMGVRYIGTIEKCRAERIDAEIEDLTYDKLLAVLKDKIWWL